MIASWIRSYANAARHTSPITNVDKSKLIQPLLSFIFGLSRDHSEDPLYEEQDHDKILKSRRYWSSKPITDIITEADNMFNRGNFLAVYEFLNRLKFHNNAEIQWRISRALFKLSRDDTLSLELRREMINEAYSIITATMKLEDNNPYVYKWMAIILDAKSGQDGLDKRVESLNTVKEYLLKAIELNPQDAVSLYILGKWCFEMANMTVTQRFISYMLYGQVPTSSFSEAYEYLLKSSEIYPDSYYIPNMYMLGASCYNMNQFYRARYYLCAASTLPARTSYEKICAEKARQLLKRLDIYDLSNNSFKLNQPF